MRKFFDIFTLYIYRKLEARDSDIREARLALREKQEELSEMTLRKELAEKRFATQQHEHEMNVEKLKRKLEEAQNQLKRKVSFFPRCNIHRNFVCILIYRFFFNRKKNSKKQWTIFKPISTAWKQRKGN